MSLLRVGFLPTPLLKIKRMQIKMTIISNVKQSLSTLKGIEAQLSSLALNSQEPEAARTFHEMMLVIGDIKNDLKKRKIEMELEEPQYKDS